MNHQVTLILQMDHCQDLGGANQGVKGVMTKAFS